MHPDDKILELIQLSYYIAPQNPADVKARTVPDDCEYVELITAGGVFHNDGFSDSYYGPGTLFWHFPGEQTVHRFKSDAPYECFVAIFRMAPPQRRLVGRISHWNSIQEVRAFTDEMLRAYHGDFSDRSVLARYVHARLLFAACKSAGHELGSGTPSVIGKALKIIEKDFSGGLDIYTLSQKLSVSVPYLHSLFKKHLGETPHRLIISKRIREARRLLASTNLDLKNIAFECGFGSAEHFCRLFKRESGMTPTEYRRKNEPPSDE